MRLFQPSILAIAIALAAPLGAWQRINDERPIVSPRPGMFDARGAFNPAVVKSGNKFIMLYRAQDAEGISRLGYASSSDGITFTREATPVLSPEVPAYRPRCRRSLRSTPPASTTIRQRACPP